MKGQKRMNLSANKTLPVCMFNIAFMYLEMSVRRLHLSCNDISSF